MINYKAWDKKKLERTRQEVEKIIFEEDKLSGSSHLSQSQKIKLQKELDDLNAARFIIGHLLRAGS